MMSLWCHSGRKKCAKLHHFLFVSFIYPNESHDFVIVLIDCDWSRRSHDLIQKPLQFSTGVSSSEICSGRNRYTCITSGIVYKSRKSLRGHKRKQHGDDVSHFTFLLCRKCHVSIPHIYSPGMDWNFSPFIFYGIVW